MYAHGTRWECTNMQPMYEMYKGGCAIAARKTWAQMQRRGKGKSLDVERRLGCGELGRSKNEIGECGKPCSGRQNAPRGWQKQIA